MKSIKTMVLAACVSMFVTGAAHAVDMDDLGVTIKIIDSDDAKGARHELRLPGAASDIAREHAEKRDGKGLSRANEARDRNEGRKSEHDGDDSDKAKAADKKDDHEDRKSGHDDSKESHDDAMDSHDDVKDSQAETHDEARESQEDVKEEQTETQQEINESQTDVKDGMEDKMENPAGT